MTSPYDRIDWAAPWLATQPPATADYDLEAQIYDLEYADRTCDLAFWCDQLAGAAGPVLELGCGTGRITTALAAAGHRVIGVDISQAMLGRAVVRRSPGFQLLGGDLRRVPLANASVGVAIAPFATFNYLLSPADQISAAAELHRALRPDGISIVEIVTIPLGSRLASGDTPRWLEQRIDCGDTRLELYAKTELDKEWNVCRYTRTVEITVGSTVRRLVMRHHWHIYTVFEACYLFMSAGFTVLDVLGDYDRRPYTGTAPRMILILRSAPGSPGQAAGSRPRTAPG